MIIISKIDELNGKGLLIHHWDTDGICSAKLIIEKLGDKITNNITPTLGNYFLTDEELSRCQGFDFIIIVDMSLPEENILTLAKNAKVLIFDHHLGKEIKSVFHHNPVIKGENPDEYPSASWIVNDYLQNPINLHGLLGIIGDHEQKIKNNKTFNQIIEHFCKEQDLTFEKLLQMAYLIDSNYKLGEKENVEKAPYYLLDNQTSADILEHEQWNKNIKHLNAEIEDILSESIDSTQDIIMKTMNSKSNIISTITRKKELLGLSFASVLKTRRAAHRSVCRAHRVIRSSKPVNKASAAATTASNSSWNRPFSSIDGSKMTELLRPNCSAKKKLSLRPALSGSEAFGSYPQNDFK